MAQKIAIVDIIEDEQSIAQMYKLKFETEGFEVFTAENGVKGLEVIEKHRPDAVLLDLMMPEMTGADMLKKLRNTDWGKDIKVIILTNVSEENAHDQVEALGVSGYIIKAQTTPHQVVDRVKQIIGTA